MAAQDVVHAVDEGEREVALVEREEVADRERVGPQVAALGFSRGQTGALGEAPHQVACELARVHPPVWAQTQVNSSEPAPWSWATANVALYAMNIHGPVT